MTCPRSHDIVWFDGDEISRFRTGLKPADSSRIASVLDDII